MSYRFLEHTSDVIIEGKNDSFEKTLEDVANGMITQMGSENAEEKEGMEFEVKEENRENLVVAALNKIVSQCEAEEFTPKKVEIEKIEGGIKISLRGEKKYPENIIKGATYHDLKIEKNKTWKITVLFDI